MVGVRTLVLAGFGLLCISTTATCAARKSANNTANENSHIGLIPKDDDDHHARVGLQQQSRSTSSAPETEPRTGKNPGQFRTQHPGPRIKGNHINDKNRYDENTSQNPSTTSFVPELTSSSAVSTRHKHSDVFTDENSYDESISQHPRSTTFVSEPTSSDAWTPHEYSDVLFHKNRYDESTSHNPSSTFLVSKIAPINSPASTRNEHSDENCFDENTSHNPRTSLLLSKLTSSSPVSTRHENSDVLSDKNSYDENASHNSRTSLLFSKLTSSSPVSTGHKNSDVLSDENSYVENTSQKVSTTSFVSEPTSTSPAPTRQRHSDVLFDGGNIFQDKQYEIAQKAPNLIDLLSTDRSERVREYEATVPKHTDTRSKDTDTQFRSAEDFSISACMTASINLNSFPNSTNHKTQKASQIEVPQPFVKSFLRDLETTKNSTLKKLPPQFSKNVNFQTDNFTDCFKSPAGGYLGSGMFTNIAAHSGDFYFRGSRAAGLRLGDGHACPVMVTVPNGMTLLFQFVDIHLKCTRASVRIDGKMKYCGSSVDDFPSKMYVFGNSATIQFLTTEFSSDDVLHFNFTAVLYSDTPQLEHTVVAKNKGYITSPDWDGHTKTLPNQDSWAHVTVPALHYVMFSFLELSPDDHVTVMAGGNSTADVIQEVHGKTVPDPMINRTDKLYVRFQTKMSMEQGTGFKFVYTFHPESAVPEQFPDGRWNCSVPYWSDIQDHFRCNLFPNCIDAEDEEECPYISPLCPKGEFYWDSSCYLYVKNSEGMSWQEASSDCQNSGRHLFSFNDASEWRHLTSLLRQYNVAKVYTGLRSAFSLPLMYSNVFQWADETVAYLHRIRFGMDRYLITECTQLDLLDSFADSSDRVSHLTSLRPVSCGSNSKEIDYVCERHIQVDQRSQLFGPIVRPLQLDHNPNHVICPSGHVTHDFLSCDLQNACWAPGAESAVSCAAPVTPLPPMFTCSNEIERVPYTLVCDHRPDCSDHSDEDFCVFPPCAGDSFPCGNQQCVPETQQCDNVEQCVTGVDELKCDLDKVKVIYKTLERTPLPPAVVHLNGRGGFVITPFNMASQEMSTSHDLPASQSMATSQVLSTQQGPSTLQSLSGLQDDSLSKTSPTSQETSTSERNFTCPDSHFLCLGHELYYCLPVYLRCNGVYDCPGREDEVGCDRYDCPGFYRCRSSHVCVHPEVHLCDGQFQCPQHDDELFCNRTCPDSCTCRGKAYFCTQRFPVHLHPELRFLEGRGSGLTPADVAGNSMLIYLSLAFCGLHQLDLPKLDNLQSLDLSDNHLTTITTQSLSQVTSLKSLTMAGNPLIIRDMSIERPFASLLVLDLSRVDLHLFNVSVITAFPNLHTLNLSNSGVDAVQGEGFRLLKQLRVLDLRGCPMTSFPRDVFEGLNELRQVYADIYKLCCPQTLPESFNLHQCVAPSDEISSCQALLRSNLYRALLAVFAAFALVGNLSSFVYRVRSYCTSINSSSSGFSGFVAHLCVSDFCMGVYLAVIGVADKMYLGSYLWKDREWMESVACQTAGFLSLLSNEVSAFLICLITLDRFLALRFPFSQLRFGARSAQVACAVAWCVGVTLAAVPLLPATSHWHYYSQTGICIPLPITRKDSAGHGYSFGIMIVLNFVLFVLIAAGQLVIFLSVRANSMSSVDTGRRSRDQTIARRLFTIAVTDFLCWFPVGLLGLLASNDVPIPGEVNVAVAILILPLNSALNPFLYTLNLVLEKRLRAKEERLKQLYMSQTKSSLRD